MQHNNLDPLRQQDERPPHLWDAVAMMAVELHDNQLNPFENCQSDWILSIILEGENRKSLKPPPK